MKHKFVKIFSPLVMLLAAIVLSAGVASAATKTYYLQAEAFTKIIEGTGISMWGYAACTDNTFTNCEAPTSPGPVLKVPANKDTLKVILRNTLGENTSLVIPGLAATPAMVPQYFTDSTQRSRVKSFNVEAGKGGKKRTYKWSAKPGTYLYHSGTHPQVQVQMGLYGAVQQDAELPSAGIRSAYKDKDGLDINFAKESILLFSEIDPALHAYVDPLATGNSGAKDTIAINRFFGPSSTLDYNPAYYLINGMPFSTSAPISVSAGQKNKTTLIRMLNAGLHTHVPTILGGAYMDVIAEDGNAYPYSKEQYSLRIPALKTKDAIMTPGGTISISKAASKTNGNVVVVAKSTFGEGAALQITHINGGPGSGTPLTPPVDMDWNAATNKFKGVIIGEAGITDVTVSGVSNRYPVFDRRLNLTNNNGATEGGMLIYLDLAASKTKALSP